ncbi:hypothetical protein DFH28DRAFT_887251 [Melampsora americana]|nr:hypothetical protein DFH28DRAFT_887251 [Melampsora americana]
MIAERDVPMQGIHTNNFTESYHRVLKYNFLSRHTLQRPDDTIQVLADNAEPEFRQSVITTSLGFQPQRTTKYQNVAKGLADSYSDTDLTDLGVVIVKSHNTQWQISSFTRPLATTYKVNTTLPKDGRSGYVNNCNCPHYVKNKSPCKHMYVLARRTAYKILETDPEMDDGHSPFVPRGITQPFNLVVNALTLVHPDTPPSSPPLHPYRSSSGMAQMPSTTGLTAGAFQYAPMVPAPLPHQRTSGQQREVEYSNSFGPTNDATPSTPGPSIPAGDSSSRFVTSDTSSRWLPDPTHLTAGSIAQPSDSYYRRIMYAPYHLQSTPLLTGPDRNLATPLWHEVPPYPPSPFVRTTDSGTRYQHSMEFASYNTHTSASHSTNSVGRLVEPRNYQRHHPYSRSHPDVPNASYVLPPPPPPTQSPYALDPFSLHRHLEPFAPVRSPNRTATTHPPVPTPEFTPAPVTTSQLDGLFSAMEAGRDRPPPPRASPPRRRAPPADAAFYSGPTRNANASDFSHESTRPAYTVPSNSQPMESSNTHQSIDQGPSILTKLEVEAMNTTELQLYKKKDDLKELLKTLHQINAEAPFTEEARILNRASLPAISAMRQRAAEFLSTLRSFNSTNRTSKQRR